MNRANFDKKLKMYLFNFNFKAEVEYINLVFGILDNKVTDEAFNKGVNSLLTITNRGYFEKYSGKRLSVADWLEVCGTKIISQQDSEKDKALGQCLKKFEDYVGAFDDYSKNAILKSLNPVEKNVFNMVGGFQDIMSRLNKGEYSTSKAKIRKEIETAFDNNYSKEKMIVIDSCPKVRKIESDLGSKLKGY